MPEPGPAETPFTALRLPVAPLAPRPGFAEELRRHLARALRPDTRPDTSVNRAIPAAATPNADITTTDTPADVADARPVTPANKETPMSTAATAATDPARPTSASLTPYLSVAGAAAAIDWYRDVLGAIETTRFVGDDGRVGHAELTIGPSRIMLADEFPEMDIRGPKALGGTSVSLHLEVVDVDHTYDRAVTAGAEGQRPPADQGHGNRNATIVDPFGHRWMFSQPVELSDSDAGTASGDGQDPSSTVETAGSTWTVTGRPPVEPGYLVLHTGDLARAQAFYGALFDWQFEVGGAGGGHVANTRFPLGIAPPGDDHTSATATADPGAAPTTATTIYFRVDDLDVYADRVASLGGTVLVRNDYPSGGNVECTDDQGYRFDLWKPAPGY